MTATGLTQSQEKERARSGFRGDIQGLRAIAVLAVLLYHSGVPALSGGYVGVDVFFVVSGFLITGHLAGELNRQGRINFAEFYARRARRILPASFAVILITVLAAMIFQPPLRLAASLADAAATALYVPNIFFAFQGTDYLAETAPSVFQQYWSLGIEEQFYFFWPLLMLAVYKICGRSRRTLFVSLLLVTLTSLALCVYLTPRSESLAFFLLPTRAWELGAGGVLAVLVVKSPKWLDRRAVGFIGWPGIALILYSLFEFDSKTPFPGWQALVPVTGTLMVILAGSGVSPYSTRRLLSVQPALFVGGISYSLYLIHWPLLVIPQDAAGLNNPLPLWMTLVLGVSAMPLAWLLHKWVEEPGRHALILTGHRARRSLGLALAISVFIAAGSGLGLKLLESRPLNAGVAVASGKLVPFPVGTTLVPTNLTPPLWNVEDSFPIVYTNGCHLVEDAVEPRVCQVGNNERAPRVVLFGDSHAAQWYPALSKLAEEGDIRLETLTKRSCPSASLNNKPKCNQWREKAIDYLSKNSPDLILLGNFAYQWAGFSDKGERWRNGLVTTLDRLPERSRVVILSDTPNVHWTPAICLSAHLETVSSCNAPKKGAFNENASRVERSLGVDVIDLTDWMCNSDWCPPIIENYVVFRDAHHLTVPFAEALAPVLRDHLLRFENSRS